MQLTKLFKLKLSSFQIIILGFALLIVSGALLLMLPIATVSGEVTPFADTLFTATSAACVTGLVVRDTGTYWSIYGKTIILLLIQIGGLGVVTIAASLTLLSGKKISLMQRSWMQDAISAPSVGGIVRLTKFILQGTFIIELAGALALIPVFLPDYGFQGVFLAIFHAVSAFCNAGFDLLGRNNDLYPSLVHYRANYWLNIVVMLLIIIGGIGFLTWQDICQKRWHFRRYRLQSKVILLTTLLLIIFPAIFFYYVDFAALPAGERVITSLFQSVTPRTAGFNTVDIMSMSDSSRAIIVCLMLIGGSPGSTAGGFKTTTLALLFANAFAAFHRKEEPILLNRRIENPIIRTAATIFLMYLLLCLGGAIFISTYESLPLFTCIYETASAVGTVGLTLGLTPNLHIASKLVLIALMFLGRVGAMTLIFAALNEKKLINSKLPKEQIMVG